MKFDIKDSVLGKNATNPDKYDATLLFSILRSENRVHYNINDDKLPFVGFDVWNCYEVSFLLDNGLPVSRVLKLIYPADSKYLVESKSLKLYLNAFNMDNFGATVMIAENNFPDDQHGFACFDGTYLFEHADPKQGFHPDWNSYIFNYNRRGGARFLASSALFWLDKYHVDGLRVDAVASMLYLDYGRKEGEWMPNRSAARRIWRRSRFLKEFNEAVYHGAS